MTTSLSNSTIRLYETTLGNKDNPDVCLERIKSEYLGKKEYFTQGLLKWGFSLVFPKVSPPTQKGLVKIY